MIEFRNIFQESAYNRKKHIGDGKDIMEEKYIQEIDIKEINEKEREKEIIKNIIRAKEDLKKANLNFEFAEFDLIDYYIYQIKAIQAKLDYLIKLAKSRNIEINRVNELEMKIEIEENKVG